MLVLIPKEHLEIAPHRALMDIISAMQHSHGERTIEQIVEAIYTGDNQLWIGYDEEDNHIGTVVTRVEDFPDKRSCIIEYMGGIRIDALEALDNVKYIEEWAKFNGCKDIRAIGRRAWKRKMKALGYEERYTIIGKEL